MNKQIHRWTLVASASAIVSASLLLGGCKSPNLYQPAATPQEVASYAAKQRYPVDQTAQENLHVTCVTDASNNQLQLRVWGGEPLSNFNLWINRGYVLHVDHVPAPKPLILNLSDFYNSNGANDLTTDKIQRVQIQINGQLYNVQGPQTM